MYAQQGRLEFSEIRRFTTPFSYELPFGMDMRASKRSIDPRIRILPLTSPSQFRTFVRGSWPPYRS